MVAADFLAIPLVRGLASDADNILLPLLLVTITAAAIAIALSWLKRRSAGDVGRAVSLLIAAIALTDAVTSAAAGNANAAFICCVLFLMTVMLQRIVPGT